MTNYRMNQRLNYLPGGALRVAPGAWPSSEITGWWTPTTGSATCVGAYQAKGAASLAASYVNLANPGTYDAAPGVAPTWDSTNGWIFNGTQYLTTGIAPTNNQAWSAVIRFSNITTNGGVIMGIQETSVAPSRWFGFEPIQSTTNVTYRNGWFMVIAGQMTSGVMAIGGNVAYRNGTAEAGTISASGSNNWANENGGINIGRNGGKNPGQLCAGYVQAVAIYSTTLDATQVDEVTDAINAL